MQKIRYKIVFVVLVYKNIDVLTDFLGTLNIPNAKVIIVNSFYDEHSLNKCKRIALEYNADFLEIPNKGYGYGNNVGCKFAMEHYEYDFLIISNSDIQISEFSALNTLNDEVAIYAPYVLIPTGKRQNPDLVSCNYFYYNFYKYGYRYNCTLLLIFARIISRVHREIILYIIKILGKEKYKIFDPHGSFIIFTSKAVQILYPLFHEDMFLYNEELFLGLKCKKCKVPVYFIPTLRIFHLEGASSESDKKISFKYNKQSFEVLDKWKKNNKC